MEVNQSEYITYFVHSVLKYTTDTVWLMFLAASGFSSSSRLVMAKVSNNGKSLGTSHVVQFPHIVYKESMIYINGEFLIMDPGYYEVSINFYSVLTSGLAADLMVNNRWGFVFGEILGKGTLNMSTIVKLNKYDYVHVRIKKGKTSIWGDANNFSIRKID